jgi:hypothetical protein
MNNHNQNGDQMSFEEAEGEENKKVLREKIHWIVTRRMAVDIKEQSIGAEREERVGGDGQSVEFDRDQFFSN